QREQIGVGDEGVGALVVGVDPDARLFHRASPYSLRMIFFGKPVPTFPDHALVIDAQSYAAVNGIANGLWTQRAVDKEVGDPALGDGEAEPAAIFEPALVADGRRDDAVAGDGCDDARMVREGLHKGAVDIAFDAGAEQMRPLTADLDQAGSVGAG